MSRYRDDRDDDYYYGGRGRRREDFYEAERPGPRDRYARGADDSRRREDFYDDQTTYERARPRYDEDYDSRRDYGDERTVLRRRPRDYDEDDFDDRGGRSRSVLDEGRDFFRRAFGGGGRRDRGRGGPSRSHVRCRDIMTRDVTVATRETTLEAVARMMRDEDTGVIPVVERAPNLTDLPESGRADVNRVEANVAGSSGKLIGLITDRDIVVRALAEGKDPRAVRAEEIMTTDIHTAQPNDRVIEAVRKMGDKQVRRIPIVDRDGTLRGIISMADVALETEDDRELAEALEEISSGSTFWNRVFG